MAITSSLMMLGWHAAIVTTKNGEIIVGHGRYAAAQYIGVDKVPVLRVDDDEAKAIARGLADNMTSDHLQQAPYLLGITPFFGRISLSTPLTKRNKWLYYK